MVRELVGKSASEMNEASAEHTENGTDGGSLEQMFGCDGNDGMLTSRGPERGRPPGRVHPWAREKSGEGAQRGKEVIKEGRLTARHRLLLARPLVLVRFCVAAEALRVAITAVVSVAAPADGHGGQWLDSRAADVKTAVGG